MAVTRAFWRGKRVFVTGHTGFKGGWLSLWLQQAGARVVGYSLAPPTEPSLFVVADVGAGMTSLAGDVRDRDAVSAAFADARPEIVFHMAAQALVSESYADPVGTYATNVMGTVHVLEAVRRTPGVRVFVNVTSDKCYQNEETSRAYREDDRLGGRDPYSSSKACAEIVHGAYSRSFFEPAGGAGAAVACVRAGNVIGGGDWAKDRLVPDAMRAFCGGSALVVRSPEATRPWQHVLEPLSGYLTLAEQLWDNPAFSGPWNFGPDDRGARSVRELLDTLTRLWGDGAAWRVETTRTFHEAGHLRLDSAKARRQLQWRPAWTCEDALRAVVSWYKAWRAGEDMRAVTLAQVDEYCAAQAKRARAISAPASIAAHSGRPQPRGARLRRPGHNRPEKAGAPV